MRHSSVHHLKVLQVLQVVQVVQVLHHHLHLVVQDCQNIQHQHGCCVEAWPHELLESGSKC